MLLDIILLKLLSGICIMVSDQLFIFALRFLKGSLSVNGVYTENLRDAWDYAHDDDNPFGLSFSTLEDQLTKRVRSNTDRLVCVYYQDISGSLD